MRVRGHVRFGFSIAMLAAIISVMGCKNRDVKNNSQSLSTGDLSGGYCAAMRGNGERINSILHSLSRLVDSYGVPKMVSGGSSGSISAFLLESILMNDIVKSAPTEEERARRAAFFLKAAWGYIEAVKSTEEGFMFIGMATLQASPHPLDDLQPILDRSTIGDVINRDEIKRMMADPTHKKDVEEQIQNFGKFEVKDKKVFFQPGLIDFKKFAVAFSRMGDFFAGRGDFYDQAGMAVLENQCWGKKVGEIIIPAQWDDIKTIPFTTATGATETCGAAFSRMVLAYRLSHIDYMQTHQNNANFVSRALDPVGSAILPVIVSTSVVSDPAFVAQYKKSLENYWNNVDREFTQFQPDFSKVQFGYWSSKEVMNRLEGAKAQASDYKTLHSVSILGNRSEANWYEVLRTSPAEPGLAAAQYLDDAQTTLSLGGWSDLAPVLVLKNAGCEEIAYITRKSPEESPFAIQISQQLGMDDSIKTMLYSTNMTSDAAFQGGSTQPSSAQLSLNAATGVWCTDWNNLVAWDKESREPARAIATDAYNAPFIVRSSFFQGVNSSSKTSSSGSAPYNRTQSDNSPFIAGCSKQ